MSNRETAFQEAMENLKALEGQDIGATTAELEVIQRINTTKDWKTRIRERGEFVDQMKRRLKEGREKMQQAMSEAGVSEEQLRRLVGNSSLVDDEARNRLDSELAEFTDRVRADAQKSVASTREATPSPKMPRGMRIKV